MKTIEGLATSSTAMVRRLRCSTDNPLMPGTPTCPTHTHHHIPLLPSVTLLTVKVVKVAKITRDRQRGEEGVWVREDLGRWVFQRGMS